MEYCKGKLKITLEITFPLYFYEIMTILLDFLLIIVLIYDSYINIAIISWLNLLSR